MTKIILGLLLVATAIAMYDGNTPVYKLTASNYNQIKTGIWFVEYYASWCGHCQSMAPEWQKAAAALKGIVNVAAIDAGSERIDYSIQGFPTIRFWNNGNQIKYESGRNAKDFVVFAIDQVRKIALQRLNEPDSGSGSGSGEEGEDDVIVLEDSSFDKTVLESEDPWFVEFYAPWCGHCKSLAPSWAALATELKGEINVAKLDATAHPEAARRAGVSGYPTIKYFAKGKKSFDDAITYNEGRNTEQMAEWARNQNGGVKNYNLLELESQEVYDKVCKSKSLCMIAFLPHILDSGEEQREAYLTTIKDVAIQYRGKPIGFTWSQGGDQLEFETILGADGSGYPALVAISHGKKLHSKMRKSFNQEHFEKFVQDILQGNGKFTQTTKDLNNVIKKIQKHEEKKQGCDEHKCTAPPGDEL